MAKTIGLVLGVVFLAVGVLGFFDNGIVSANPDALFVVDMMHNIVHLVTGLVLVLVALMSLGSLPLTLKVLGVVYLLVGVVGMFAPNVLGSVMATNANDHYLHLVLGVVLLLVGFMPAGSNEQSAPQQMM